MTHLAQYSSTTTAAPEEQVDPSTRDLVWAVFRVFSLNDALDVVEEADAVNAADRSERLQCTYVERRVGGC